MNACIYECKYVCVCMYEYGERGHACCVCGHEKWCICYDIHLTNLEVKKTLQEVFCFLFCFLFFFEIKELNTLLKEVHKSNEEEEEEGDI